MFTIVTVISNIIERQLRKVKIRRLGELDIQTASQVAPFGDDASPNNGVRAIYAKTSKNGKDVIVGYINQSLLAEVGEKRIYSVQDDGSISTYIWLKNDGSMEIGGDSDFMVRFGELKEGFDQLKQDHNSLVSAFNAHTHLTAGTGTPSPPTPGAGIPATASTASIDDSKIEEIKTS